jgi:hypothetical protein
MDVRTKTRLQVSAETISLLTACLAWLFSYRSISKAYLEEYMRSMMLEEPAEEFIKELHVTYCKKLEVRSRLEKRKTNTKSNKKGVFNRYS